MADDPDYFAFLLRLWREKKTGPGVWRASLENSETGEKKGFASLEALMVYLVSKTTGKEYIQPEKEV